MTRKPLIVFTDAFSTRLFFSSEAMRYMADTLHGDLDVLFTFDLDLAAKRSNFEYRKWAKDFESLKMISQNTLLNGQTCSPKQKLRLMIDERFEDWFGYFRINMRLSLKYGFMKDRMRWGHSNPYLNPSLGYPFPRWEWFLEQMKAWYFNDIRPVPPGIESFMKHQTNVLIISNLQFRTAQTYIRTAKKTGIPILGHIASWDHPVGKGIVYPGCLLYVVQNQFMKEALEQYHGISGDKIVETGWPQMDIYANIKSKIEYYRIVESFGLSKDRGCILFAGNSPSNFPHESRLVEKLFAFWGPSGLGEKYSLIFRPHPRDFDWKKRFQSLFGKSGIFIQPPSYTDGREVSVLLQHVDAVITNAGTFLLDSLANNRPTVCVMFDEGAPKGKGFATQNITGHHYRDLLQSDAFYKAWSFDDLIKGIWHCVQNPGEKKENRKKICSRLIGAIDGRAGKRLADVLIKTVHRCD